MEIHITTRIVDKFKHTHWCFDFTCKNIMVFMARLTLIGHAMRSHRKINKNSTLLRHPDDTLFCAVSEALEECYLYYNGKERQWVKVGKAVSSYFLPRAGLVNWGGWHRLGLTKSGLSKGNTFDILYPLKSNVNRSDRA